MVSVFITISKSAFLVPIAEVINQSKWVRLSANPLLLSELEGFNEASKGPWGCDTRLLLAPKVAGATASLVCSSGRFISRRGPIRSANHFFPAAYSSITAKDGFRRCVHHIDYGLIVTW